MGKLNFNDVFIYEKNRNKTANRNFNWSLI